MAKLLHTDSRRMYSWWWDSHVSPKNSIWLQENLTDMDAKVKSMIKLIEEDADSFAMKAEMYYEKRPKLMKMVEEFYRAYRALAERYDHATGALHQAHQTMTKAFQNEITEDELRALSVSFGLENDGNFKEHIMREELDLSEANKKDQNTLSVGNIDKEMQALMEVLANFEAQKESSLAQYKQNLENLSHQELEFSNIEENSKGFAERANKAEDEVESLRKSLNSLVVENKRSLVKLASVEDEAKKLNKRAEEAETEAETLKQALTELGLEKESTAVKYKESMEIISSLERKLSCAQEDIRMVNGQFEIEVTKLKSAEELNIYLEQLNMSLLSELESLKLETSSQSEELAEKKREFEEKKSRLLKVESAFKNLQLLHVQTEKQLESLSAEKCTLDSEKASLVTQLQEANENLDNLLKKNTILQNSVSDAEDEIEAMKMKLVWIEGSCQFLENEKSDLINEKVKLAYQLVITSQGLEDFEKKYRELEEKQTVLEIEKETILCEVEIFRLMVKESKLKEAKQITEIEKLHEKVLDMQNKSVALQEENLKLIDEKILLVKDVLDLQEKNHTPLSNLSLIFKNIFNEKVLEIEELQSTLENLQAVCVGLGNKISMMDVKLEKAQLENMDLIKLLKKTEDNLSTITLDNGQLKDLLIQKETEIKKFEDEINSKEKSIESLVEKIGNLEGENGRIGGELNAYVAAISSLKDCISSLEINTCFSVQLWKNNDADVKPVLESHVENHKDSSEEQKETDKSTEVRELEARVKGIEKTVIETNTKLEAVIEELESKVASNQDNKKPELTKDIMLDHIYENIKDKLEREPENTEIKRKTSFLSWKKKKAYYGCVRPPTIDD